jgi:hypothetical protein
VCGTWAEVASWVEEIGERKHGCGRTLGDAGGRWERGGRPEMGEDGGRARGEGWNEGE